MTIYFICFYFVIRFLLSKSVSLTKKCSELGNVYDIPGYQKIIFFSDFFMSQLGCVAWLLYIYLILIQQY